MTVVHAMLGNAAVAAVLALIAVAVGFASRSPAVRHAAWMLVLLKLVTPPLFIVPLPVLPASWATTTTEPPADWPLVAWAVGAVGWLGWQGRRIIRFRRRVRAAEVAPPEVVETTARLAAALGIDRPPPVKVMPGICSPMLWGWGRGAVILFPTELLARLAPEARDTLLAHELAHFLRRDHWVRVLEYVAAGLYWWHPAVWLARGGIEAAEEECCDAWVVGGLSASPRRYAEALLATVDFEAELRRPCLPPGACAASRSARLLHRRLVHIIHADRPPRLPGGMAVRVVILAALLTQPVLRATVPEPVPVMQEPEPVAIAPRGHHPRRCPRSRGPTSRGRGRWSRCRRANRPSWPATAMSSCASWTARTASSAPAGRWLCRSSRAAENSPPSAPAR